jgi:hypothetical protein
MNELIDRLLPIPEVAQALGVKPRTIRWWIQIGKLGSNKPSGDPTSRQGRRLVPVSEVNRIINESRIPARREFLTREGDQSLPTTAPSRACGD